MTSAPQLTLAEQMASQAEFIVNNLQHTYYQHVDRIDVDSGVYDCDCNGFVAFVMGRAAPDHYAKIPKEGDQLRPRAFKYYDFFTSPTLASVGGWRRIETLKDARRGDIMAWRFPEIEQHHDTGHVLFIAETPTSNEKTFSARVYDSAVVAHYDDTRTDGKFKSGVGTGFINFRVNEAGGPSAFQFGPSKDKWTSLQVAIGRVEPIL